LKSLWADFRSHKMLSKMSLRARRATLQTVLTGKGNACGGRPRAPAAVKRTRYATTLGLVGTVASTLMVVSMRIP
jgi:hypothetical protein